MKICILSCFGDLLLKDMGSSVRIYHLAKGLASLGHRVHIVIPSDTMMNEHVDGMVIHGVKGLCPKVVLRIFSKLLGVSTFRSLLFFDLSFILRVTPIIRGSNVIQVEQQTAGGLLIPIIGRIWKKPVVVDCHDIFQALRVKHTSAIRKILETFLEKLAYKHANVVLTVSEREKECLISFGINRRSIEIIPNGVDTEAFNPFLNPSHIQDKYGLRNSYTIVFVGNMEYWPNQVAVKAIASEIAPIVQREVNNTKFLIVGRTTKKVQFPNLTFTGIVENVAELLAASDVAIAPLFQGSGTRLKILEYFSCGLPVVSTTVGVEGLEVENEVTALIEDNMNDFAIKVTKLLSDKALSMRLGKAAREFVVNKYDWKKIVKQLNTIYHNLLQEEQPKEKQNGNTFFRRMSALLKRSIYAISHPLLKNHIYTVRRGLAKGLKRKGGLGFIPQIHIPKIVPLTQEEKFLMNLDLKGQTVYDIGSAEGIFTIFFGQAVGKKGKVVAFEPHPEHYLRIIENAKLNKFNHITVRRIALGNERKKEKLAFLSLAPGSGSLQKDIKARLLQVKGGRIVEVEVDLLDHQIATSSLPKPDLVKIDVQGLELDVLLGMSRAIMEYKPKLFVEVHGGFKNWKIKNLLSIVEFLIENGYSIYHVESKQMITSCNAQIVNEDEHLYCS